MVRRLLLLNGLAILGVIFFHAGGWGFTALFAWKARYLPYVDAGFQPLGSADYFALRLIEQLVVACIPAFLFVSGYFIAVAAGRNQATVGWEMVGARVKGLLIPYLVWSTAVLVVRLLEGHVYPLSEYLSIYLTGTANPAYYYVILLCQFYLISPFLVPLARKRWRVLLLVAAAAQTVIQIQQYPAFLGLSSEAVEPFLNVVPKWLFPARLFWFSFGVVAGFHLPQLKAWVNRWRWHLLATLILSFCVGIPEWELYFRMSGLDWLSHRETLIDTVYSAAFLLCFIAFDKLTLPFPRQLSELGAKSFGIYLVHSPVMEYTARAIYHLAPAILSHQILMQPILMVLGLVVPLVAMEFVARSPARRFYSYLFGK